MTNRPWLSLLFAIALIVMSVYTINTFSKDPTKSTTSKIVVDVFAALFIIGGIVAGIGSIKALRSV